MPDRSERPSPADWESSSGQAIAKKRDRFWVWAAWLADGSSRGGIAVSEDEAVSRSSAAYDALLGEQEPISYYGEGILWGERNDVLRGHWATTLGA